MKPLTSNDLYRSVTEGSVSSNTTDDDEHPLLLLGDHDCEEPPTTVYPPTPGAINTMESFNFENGEAMLVQELNNLSVQERERLLHEVHGVEDDIETPELVRNSLQGLQKAIDTLKESANCDAYTLAESVSPDFVRSDRFRLMFLRALRFDCEAAALRLFAHFEKKLELFGEEKLCKKKWLLSCFCLKGLTMMT